jgi:succinate-semialdehyde dehydrogenase/glutarate-semialdehyde dehydrogenase
MTSYSELQLHIDGEWLGAGSRRTHRVINPANGATLGELPLVDTADLERALQAAERGFRLWKRSTAEERARVLKGAAQLIRQRVEHIAQVNSMGKNVVAPTVVCSSARPEPDPW